MNDLPPPFIHTPPKTKTIQAKVNPNEPTEFTVVEGMTIANREWPELKKEIKISA